MTIDEQVRHDLFTGLQAAVGVEPAKLMMTAIPPFSWNEVATKADLAQFATRDEMHTEFAGVRLEMARSDSQMREHITKNFQNLFFQIVAFNISTAGIVIAAVHYLS